MCVCVCVCIREFITAVEGSSTRRHLHKIFKLGLHFVETLSCEVFEMSGGVCSDKTRKRVFIYLSQSFASFVFRNILILLLLIIHDDDWSEGKTVYI